MQKLGWDEGIVFSDSKEVVDSLSHNQPIAHDWRAFQDIWAAWLLQGQMEGKFRTVYCSRDEEHLRKAHQLANVGRIKGGERVGT